MRTLFNMAALLVLSGCTIVPPDCYVGFSILPLGPIVQCGFGAAADVDEEEDAE